MLTIFTTAKAFAGHIGIIQRNALRSWTLLRPRCEIILVGDDEGGEALANELGIIYQPTVQKSPYGTPLVRDIFAKAELHATNRLLCYANADIIFMGDFIKAVGRVANWERPFLMAGRKWNFNVTKPLKFDRGWEEKFRTEVLTHGEKSLPYAIDFFVFPKGMWPAMPDFVVGKAGWDNWIIFEARRLRIPVIDANGSIMAVHQNHDYSHAPGSFGWKPFDWKNASPEDLTNTQLMWNEAKALYTLGNATHVLTPEGIRKAWSYPYIKARFKSRWIRSVRIAKLVGESVAIKWFEKHARTKKIFQKLAVTFK